MFSLLNQITDLNHSQESATISQMLNYWLIGTTKTLLAVRISWGLKYKRLLKNYSLCCNLNFKTVKFKEFSRFKKLFVA